MADAHPAGDQRVVDCGGEVVYLASGKLSEKRLLIVLCCRVTSGCQTKTTLGRPPRVFVMSFCAAGLLLCAAGILFVIPHMFTPSHPPASHTIVHVRV